MRDIIVETESMTRFNLTADTALEAGRMLSGFVLVYGKAGRGKSVAADRYYYERGGAYVRVWQNWSQSAFLQHLLFEVRGKNMDMPRHNGNRCKELIVDILENDPKPLFIDEADRLSIDRIEDLRDIFEMTGVPIVLIGEEGIWGLLRERRRIMSRVVYEVEFTPISPAEASIFLKQAANLNCSPEICKKITTQADGDFRVVRNIALQLEKVAKASEKFDVDAAMLETALCNIIHKKK